MIRLRGRHLVLMGALLFGGCSSDSPLDPADNIIVGRSYDLVTVNEQPLPYLYSHVPHTILWQELVFNTASGWRMVSEHCEELPCEGDAIFEMVVVGTYTVSGNRIDFRETSPGNLRFEGVIHEEGGRLVVDINHPRLLHTTRVYVEQ